MALLTLKAAVDSIDLLQVDQNRIEMVFYILRLFFLFPISPVLQQNVSFRPLIVFVLTEYDDAVPLPIIG